MSDEEWVHAGPHESGTARDGRLHAAFGAELEALSIGPSPIGAVLRDGFALRKRRRAAWSGGLAGLLVLPVAAAVVFGGSGPGGGPALTAGGDRKPEPHSTATATATAIPPTPTTTRPTANLSESPTIGPTHIERPASSPDPMDQLTVLGSGTYNGHAWRLVRDRFIVLDAKDGHSLAGDPTSRPHLPFSAATRSDTIACEFVGFQWGDRAPGTVPDFTAGGACGPGLKTLSKDHAGAGGYGVLPTDPEGVASGSTGGMWATGEVDPDRVATVSLTVGDVTVGPTPVFRRGTEPVAYWAVAVPYPGLGTEQPRVSGFHYTYYDVNGVVVGTGDGHL